VWLQLLEVAAGTTGFAGMAFALADHTRPGHRAETRTAGAADAPTPRPLTGPAWERAWEQAEQIGWDRLVAAGVLQLVGSPAVDPGNPLGSRLVLVEHVAGALGDVRILLAINAAPGPDGRHDLVALPVPPDTADPLTAAAWTYDDPDHPVRTTRADYARLTRRT
jgi:hypothetical protein